MKSFSNYRHYNQLDSVLTNLDSVLTNLEVFRKAVGVSKVEESSIVNKDFSIINYSSTFNFAVLNHIQFANLKIENTGFSVCDCTVAELKDLDVDSLIENVKELMTDWFNKGLSRLDSSEYYKNQYGEDACYCTFYYLRSLTFKDNKNNTFTIESYIIRPILDDNTNELKYFQLQLYLKPLRPGKHTVHIYSDSKVCDSIKEIQNKKR